MKKDELMLWDWVYHDYQIDHPFHSEMVSEASQVIGIPDEETIRLSNETIDAGGELDDYDISPIPLTDKTLEKNGFVLHPQCGYQYKENVNDLFSFRFSVGGLFKSQFAANINGRYIKLNYVHELQHALRMCGLSELANNFKI